MLIYDESSLFFSSSPLKDYDFLALILFGYIFDDLGSISIAMSRELFIIIIITFIT